MDIVQAHLKSMRHPIDSYLEDALLAGDLYRFQCADECIGYFVVEEQAIDFFYVVREYYRLAPALLERAVRELNIEKVFVITMDSAICALIVEWDYDMARSACWFTDSGADIDRSAKAQSALFRTAEQRDVRRIREVSGEFFDEVSGGFNSLEERVGAQTIFVLEEDGELLGVGITEDGRLCAGYTSIGMFVNPAHRQKGAAKTILLNLKEHVYARGRTPIAGCWYYNTLSRKSLEAAGMIATSLGYNAILKERDRPPKRTGNPPGELVE